jgi:hypothetical protein
VQGLRVPEQVLGVEVSARRAGAALVPAPAGAIAAREAKA